MAGFKDYSGKIVIDEHEAMLDIRNIDEARAKLAEARRLLDPNKITDSRMQGMTREAFAALLGKACKDLDDRQLTCDETKNSIRAAVEKYQRIDRELSEIMRRR